MLPGYAELHCLSNFSFLRGASHPEELAARAAALGYAALAITDECSLAGVVRAHVAAKQAGIRLLVGTEIRLEDGPTLVLLAVDREGYGHLCALVTRGRRRAPKGTYRLARADLDAGLPRCLALLVPGAIRDAGAFDARAADARWLAARFPASAWITAELHLGGSDRAELARLAALARASGLPLVAAGGVEMHVRSRKSLHDVLAAIRLGKPVAECGTALAANAERHLRLRARLARIYPPELLAETVRIAARCTFSLDELRYEYPDEIVPPGETPSSWLRELAYQGLAWRFAGAPPPGRGQRTRDPHPGSPPQGGERPASAASWCAGPDRVPAHVVALVERELALIAELGYEPYFLTVFDIVRFARAQGILCQGRGSAANSAVCYALGITEVDPARMSMLFERFISRERNEPPDIDVDFEHQRREEVIQYIYAKYGRERAALAATVITYRTKSAIRDVGKALGMDPAQVDRLAKSRAWWDRRGLDAGRLAAEGFDPESPVIRQLAALVDTLAGFPRHLSQHTGGFVISRGPLERLVPIENAAMPQRSVIQWDKDDLDALGLLKVDVLALGMLSAIRRALGALGMRMQDVPPEDPAVYEMVSRGDTVGVFQIESRAQMAMLPRLRPRCFFDLVIEVAIVRPGPIQGGMVHPYLRRRNGEEPVEYPSEAVRGVLERTLGVPIFQEQVMSLAMVAAGFTPGEADALRRAMAAWRRKGGLEPFEERLKEGMRARGYPPEFAERIYRQILGFGEYGFPESHAASFALLVYVSAWLKRHHPAAFLAALLNSQPMGFYAPAQLVQDARRHGVEVQPPDVNESDWESTLEPVLPACARREPSTPTPTFPLQGEGTDVNPSRPPSLLEDEAGAGARGDPSSVLCPLSSGVRLGLHLVRGLSQAGAERIVAARRERRFTSVADLTRRARLDARDLKALAAANALASFAGHRRLAYWDVAGVEARAPLLADAPVHEVRPAIAAPSEGESIVADYASLSLTLGRHPLALLRDRLSRLRLATAEEIRAMPHRHAASACGIVVGRQRPDTASGVIFVTLEDETGCVNVVVWAKLAERQRRELLGARLMAVHGVIEREGEVVHLVARRIVDHSALLGRLATRSRDFH
ncbi:MAG: error-prone DNA polymerase [Burkholderiales bacterium]|nr:error-prone DNA polymerase [Burkholderiales bacterium]